MEILFLRKTTTFYFNLYKADSIQPTNPITAHLLHPVSGDGDLDLGGIFQRELGACGPHPVGAHVAPLQLHALVLGVRVDTGHQRSSGPSAPPGVSHLSCLERNGRHDVVLRVEGAGHRNHRVQACTVTRHSHRRLIHSVTRGPSKKLPLQIVSSVRPKRVSSQKCALFHVDLSQKVLGISNCSHFQAKSVTLPGSCQSRSVIFDLVIRANTESSITRRFEIFAGEDRFGQSSQIPHSVFKAHNIILNVERNLNVNIQSVNAVDNSIPD
mmetsp:Transcript_57128/g.100329  ORF Transcript_57128/g.100329 Transcript_57128/m.100329 type:complete len:269 (-) Transcript_57128:109-915(-)